jgi:hypothetical protein
MKKTLKSIYRIRKEDLPIIDIVIVTYTDGSIESNCKGSADEYELTKESGWDCFTPKQKEINIIKKS